MITIDLRESYGCENQKELMQTIQELQSMGMSDEKIQKILERSKQNDSNRYGYTKRLC